MSYPVQVATCYRAFHSVKAAATPLTSFSRRQQKVVREAMRSLAKSTFAAVVCMAFVLSHQRYDTFKTKGGWKESLDIEASLIRLLLMIFTTTAVLKCVSFTIKLSAEDGGERFQQIMGCLRLSALLVSVLYCCFFVCQLSKLILLWISALHLRLCPTGVCSTRHNQWENETLPVAIRLLVNRVGHLDSNRTLNPVFFHEYFNNELALYVAVIWIVTAGFLSLGTAWIVKLTKLLSSASAFVTLSFVCYLALHWERPQDCDWQSNKLLQHLSDQYSPGGIFNLIIDMYNALAIYFFASSRKWSVSEIAIPNLFVFGLLFIKGVVCSLMAQTSAIDEIKLTSLQGFIPGYLSVLLEQVSVMKSAILWYIIPITTVGLIIFTAHLVLCESIVDSLNFYNTDNATIRRSTKTVVFCISGAVASLLAMWPTWTVQIAFTFVVHNIAVGFGPILGWAAVTTTGYFVGRNYLLIVWKHVGGSSKMVTYLFHAWRHLAFGIFLLSITGDMGKFLSSLIMFHTSLNTSKSESELHMFGGFVSMVPFGIVAGIITSQFLRTKFT